MDALIRKNEAQGIIRKIARSAARPVDECSNQRNIESIFTIALTSINTRIRLDGLRKHGATPHQEMVKGWICGQGERCGCVFRHRAQIEKRRAGDAPWPPSLKEVIPKQTYKVVISGAIGGKIVGAKRSERWQGLSRQRLRRSRYNPKRNFEKQNGRTERMKSRQPCISAGAFIKF